MAIGIANAPCSWGVEFAGDPRNPDWRTVIRENAEAGFAGIELGPVGFMPEDPPQVADILEEHGQSLTGGAIFRPFHDPGRWEDVLDGAVRTCRALRSHDAKHLVLIDSIAERRASTAGRAPDAVQMNDDEWDGFRSRIADIARIGTEEYGLTSAIHAHAAGFMDFEPELEKLLDGVDQSILKICLDTGHHAYAGFDPAAFAARHIDRISYMHFKDIDPDVKSRAIANGTGFHDACGQGIFCNLGKGEVDFPRVRQILLDAEFDGWCTVEQDCDPAAPGTDPLGDARANRRYLDSIGF